MRILLFGATGNLGSRLLPALLAHHHTVFVLVRSPSKLHALIPSALTNRLVIFQGDALDSLTISDLLREHDIDAVVNTAGGPEFLPWKEQTHGQITASITSAAVRVGNERGTPLRAWVIGGMGSLPYPGTEGRVDDFMPGWMTAHMRGTEEVVRGIPGEKLKWSLLCVAMMYGEEERVGVLERPRGNELVVAAGRAPGWQDSWVKQVPIVGRYVNLVPVIRGYRTKYEDVADFIAGDLAGGRDEFVGELVGYKSVGTPGKS